MAKLDVPTESTTREQCAPVEFLDASHNVLSSTYHFAGAVTADWSYRQRIFVAPANTTYMRINLSLWDTVEIQGLVCQKAWFDDVAACRYSKPTLSELDLESIWDPVFSANVLTTSEGNCTVLQPGVFGSPAHEPGVCTSVADPDSLSGAALYWPAATGLAVNRMIYGSSDMQWVPGVYRLAMRIKFGTGYSVNPNTEVLRAYVMYPSQVSPGTSHSTAGTSASMASTTSYRWTWSWPTPPSLPT